MLSDFASMWGGHLSRTIFANYRIEQTRADAEPTHSAACRVGLNAVKFEESEIDKLLLEGDIESPQIEWVALVVLAPKIDG